jgi:hypothetical protein
MNKAIYTPEQRRARALAQHRRWYHDNKDWVNPKRYANWKLKCETDPAFYAQHLEKAREASRIRRQSTLLKAA